MMHSVNAPACSHGSGNAERFRSNTQRLLSRAIPCKHQNEQVSGSQVKGQNLIPNNGFDCTHISKRGNEPRSPVDSGEDGAWWGGGGRPTEVTEDAERANFFCVQVQHVHTCRAIRASHLLNAASTPTTLWTDSKVAARPSPLAVVCIISWHTCFVPCSCRSSPGSHHLLQASAPTDFIFPPVFFQLSCIECTCMLVHMQA